MRPLLLLIVLLSSVHAIAEVDSTSSPSSVAEVDVIANEEKEDSTCIYLAIEDSSEHLSPALTIDSTSHELRSSKKATIDKYKNDGDYDYDRAPSEFSVSLWQRLKMWLQEKLFGFAIGETGSTFFDFLEWIIIITAFVVIAVFLSKSNVRGLLYGASKRIEIDGEEVEENIHELDLESLVTASLKEKDFRKAVRYLFLQTLKALADSNHIVWVASKTNRSYLYEIQQPELRTAFSSIIRYFEYVWYGEFKISEEEYFTLQTEVYNCIALAKKNAKVLSAERKESSEQKIQWREV